MYHSSSKFFTAVSNQRVLSLMDVKGIYTKSVLTSYHFNEIKSQIKTKLGIWVYGVLGRRP